MRYLALFVACLSLMSCATLANGRNETISVSSSPSEAKATLACETGAAESGLTPIVFTIRRNAGDCNLTLSKDGYAERVMLIEQGVNPSYWANMAFTPLAPASGLLIVAKDPQAKLLGVGFLITGFFVFGTDFFTGAVHTHRPSHVDVVLEPKRAELATPPAARTPLSYRR